MGSIPSREKSFDPYVESLNDLCKCPVIDAKWDATVTVKVVLLHFLCDIPAFSKVLHISGQAALRSCPYHPDVGHYW